MFLLPFFLLSADSLPPLPDLSLVIFPEPPLWIESKENFIILSGYAGNFYGGDCNLNFQHLNISAHYEQKVDWDSLKSGSVMTSYSIPLPHLWLKPSMYGSLLQRNNDYKLLSPGLDFSSSLPWAIIFGRVNSDLWQINRTDHIEEETKLEIIFDRTIYLPHFEISHIYTNKRLKPKFTGKLHIRNLHLSIGSPIFYGPLSPCLELQYLDPKIKIGTEIKSGKVFKTLRNYFDPETPLKYKIPVPDESLKVGVSFKFKLDFFQHNLALHSSYKNWYSRLTAGDDFGISTIQDIQEINIIFSSKNNFIFKSINFGNVFYFHYNWVDYKIPFLAQYALYDTLNINYGLLDISLETKYLSNREGFLDRTLSPVFIINPIIGVKFNILKIFLSVHNLTDERKEIFDEYFLNHRQYACGIEINYKF